MMESLNQFRIGRISERLLEAVDRTCEFLRCQSDVSRHAKCYRTIDRRARNRVTDERTDTWGELEWDHKRHESIWSGCANGIRERDVRKRGACWMRSAR